MWKTAGFAEIVLAVFRITKLSVDANYYNRVHTNHGCGQLKKNWNWSLQFQLNFGIGAGIGIERFWFEMELNIL